MPDLINPIDSLVAVSPQLNPEPFVIHTNSGTAEEVLVPIAFFLVVFGVAVLFMYYRFRTRRLIQEERMRAMELHIPIPPEPQPVRGNPFIMPLLLTGSGLGLLVLWLNVGSDDRIVALAFGAISLLAGMGWLLAIRLNAAARDRQERRAEMETSAYVAALERSGQAPSPPAPPAPPAM